MVTENAKNIDADSEMPFPEIHHRELGHTCMNGFRKAPRDKAASLGKTQLEESKKHQQVPLSELCTDALQKLNAPCCQSCTATPWGGQREGKRKML